MPTAKRRTSDAPKAAAWTFLTNHAHVLLCIAQSPELRIRDIAHQVGITERAVQRIVAELEEAGYLTHERDGRRNHYAIHADMPLRHPIERHRSIASLIALVLSGGRPRTRVRSERASAEAVDAPEPRERGRRARSLAG